MPRTPLPVDSDEERAQLRLTAQPQAWGEPLADHHEIELLDVSATGARIGTYRCFHPGQTVYLTVDQIKSISCEIRWARAGEIGLAFKRTLNVAMLEHLATAHRAR
ncbi:PilZ domain-containing protein [Sphingomonas sp. IW22]|uniref:PilZ domain-containing protein n=1 Tax=Sphingomonas sp. IW22 TaxID=3242489 RepID=UPI003522A46D